VAMSGTVPPGGATTTHMGSALQSSAAHAWEFYQINNYGGCAPARTPACLSQMPAAAACGDHTQMSAPSLQLQTCA